MAVGALMKFFWKQVCLVVFMEKLQWLFLKIKLVIF